MDRRSEKDLRGIDSADRHEGFRNDEGYISERRLRGYVCECGGVSLLPDDKEIAICIWGCS